MKYFFCLITAIIILTGCEKYLDQKPDIKLALPNTIASLQGLLDNDATMNVTTGYPGEISADNYYVPDATLAALTVQGQKNMYTWESDITLTEFPNHWSALYDVVTVSNVVMESLNKITPGIKEQTAWDNARGSALVYRAKSFLAVIGYWTKAYSETTATAEMGIPLRISSDYNVVSTRANLKDSYNQVLSDLKQAIPLLPENPQHVMRPSKGAAFGLLARTYLFMGMYDSAAVYADKCIATSGALLNYNSLVSSATYPVKLFNSEVLMHTRSSTPQIIQNTRAKVDSALYVSYSSNDLRKIIFFKDNGDKTFGFRGSYNESGALFNGVALDEIWLIKAECMARTGNINAAMDALNTLMIFRWKSGTFVAFKATDMASALQVILQERRKELIFRDLRWQDLKRLNLEASSQQTIYRKISGQTYQLPPNDNRYALPIPSSVIQISGMQQNPR